MRIRLSNDRQVTLKKKVKFLQEICRQLHPFQDTFFAITMQTLLEHFPGENNMIANVGSQEAYQITLKTFFHLATLFILQKTHHVWSCIPNT